MTVEAKLLARVPAACAAAVGHPFTIRLDKQTTIRGTIVAAEFGRFYYTPRGAAVVFKVTMECGTAKARKEFFVRQLPQ